MIDELRKANSILRMLNESDWKSLSAEMQTIELKQSEILFHPATPIQKVYFPINCLVSLITVFEDGASAEMATVGFEGAVDIRAVLGSGLTTTEHIVQVPGLALATDSDSFQKSRVDLMSFNDALQQYVQAFTTHVLQSVACNAVHSVRSRAAKWLLLCQDRNGTDTFPITQQFMSEMLGVSRSMVNGVARNLQEAGYIRYSRGRVTITNRQGLQNAACECYQIITGSYLKHGLMRDSH